MSVCRRGGIRDGDELYSPNPVTASAAAASDRRPSFNSSPRALSTNRLHCGGEEEEQLLVVSAGGGGVVARPCL